MSPMSPTRPTSPERRARWEHFAHEADIGVRGLGDTKARAFEQAALALTAVVTETTVRPRDPVSVECSAPDDEMLFVDWLNCLIFEMSTRKYLFGRFEVTIGDHRLVGTAWGEPVDRERHEPAVEPKGATYTELRVAFDDGEWLAQTVVDV